MKRRIFNLLAAVSLLSCIATVALWVRSYYRESSIFRFGAVCLHLRCQRGIASVHHTRVSKVDPHSEWVWDDRRLGADYYKGEGASADWGFAGFRWYRIHAAPAPQGMPSDTLAQWHLNVPLWFISATLAILPATASARFCRKRPHDGHCPTCNYDLRATPERCPECGTLASKPETVKT